MPSSSGTLFLQDMIVLCVLSRLLPVYRVVMFAPAGSLALDSNECRTGGDSQILM
jgi:hypothetical protein